MIVPALSIVPFSLSESRRQALPEMELGWHGDFKKTSKATAIERKPPRTRPRQVQSTE